MRTQTLRQARGARPFRPFALRTKDGRTIEVPGPEHMAVSPSGRLIVVVTSDDDLHFLRQRDVVAITPRATRRRRAG